jgi:hypothetical protein
VGKVEAPGPKPHDMSVAILYMRGVDARGVSYEKPVIVFTPSERLEALRKAAKAKQFALRRHTLEKYGVVVWWRDVFRKSYNGKPAFFPTLDSFEKFAEDWIEENIKTKNVREDVKERFSRIIEEVTEKIDKFIYKEEKKEADVFEYEVNWDVSRYACIRADAIFKKGIEFFHGRISGSTKFYSGALFNRYICIRYQKSYYTRIYIWIKRGLDPLTVLEKIGEGGLQVLKDISSGDVDLRFNEDDLEVKEAIDYLKQLITAYRIMYE